MPSLLQPAAAPETKQNTPIRRIGVLQKVRKFVRPVFHMYWMPFTRMAYSTGGRVLYLFAQLRRLATTAAATAIGAFNLATQHPEPRVELKPGDPAPDFSMPGSDGRTYRLKDLAGRPVVLAWFPKAFTGG
jgi:hypothetical protein